MSDDLVKRLREHATDWNGEQLVDKEPAKGDPTAGLMREAADRIEAMERELQRRDFIPDAVVNSRAYSEFRARVAVALRNEALEEAARVAETTKWPYDTLLKAFWASVASEIAAAIRALKEKE